MFDKTDKTKNKIKQNKEDYPPPPPNKKSPKTTSKHTNVIKTDTRDTNFYLFYQ